MAAENSATSSNVGGVGGLAHSPNTTDKTPPTSEAVENAPKSKSPKGTERMSIEKAEGSKKRRKKKRASVGEDKTPSSDDDRKKRRSSKKKKSSTPQEYGESLEECTDRDWQSADPAYNSELINLKKKANKITVFSAHSNTKIVHKGKNKNKGGSISSPGTLTASQSENELTDMANVEINVDPNTPLSSDKLLEAKADAIGKLVAGVVKMYLKDRRKDAIELEVCLHTKDGVNIDISQAVTADTTSVPK